MRQQFKWMMNDLCPFLMGPISWGMGTKHQNSVLILLGVQRSSWLFRLAEYCGRPSFPSVLKASPPYSTEPMLCYRTWPWGIGCWWSLALLGSAPKQRTSADCPRLSRWLLCSHKDPQMWKEGPERGHVLGRDSAHLCRLWRWGGATSQWTWVASRRQERQEKESPLEPPEKNVVLLMLWF